MFDSDLTVKLSQIHAKSQITNISLSLPETDSNQKTVMTSSHAATYDGGQPYPKLALEADFLCTPVALYKLLYKEDRFMKTIHQENSITGLSDNIFH